MTRVFKKIVWRILDAGRRVLSPRIEELPPRVRGILVMRNGFLGDILQTTPVVANIKTNFPDTRIYYWVSKQAAPALLHNTDIDTIISPETLGFASGISPLRFLKIAIYLRKRGIDLAICLGTDPIYGFLAWIGGIRYRVGLIGEKNKSAFLSKYVIVDKADRTSSQQAYCDVLQTLNLKIPLTSHRIQFKWTEQDQHCVDQLVGESKGYITLFTGGGPNKYRPWANRRWPTSSWIELLQLIRTDLPQLEIVLFGSHSEVDVVTQIASTINSPNVLNLVNKTTFNQLGPLLKGSRLLISNDSAPVFIAAAVQCPSIVLYGPEWSERTRPLGTEKWHPVTVEIACRDNCASFPAVPLVCNNECMRDISVNAIWAKVQKAMNII